MDMWRLQGPDGGEAAGLDHAKAPGGVACKRGSGTSGLCSGNWYECFVGVASANL